MQKKSDGTHRGGRWAETGGIWTKSSHERKQQSKNSQPGSQWLVSVKRNIFTNCLFILSYSVSFFLKKKIKKFPLKNSRSNTNELNETAVCPHRQSTQKGQGQAEVAPCKWGAKRKKIMYSRRTKLCSVHVWAVLEAHGRNALLPP